MWFFHNGPLYTFLALSSFCEVAQKKKEKRVVAVRTFVAAVRRERTIGADTHTLEVVVWLLFFYKHVRYRDYLASNLLHTDKQTKVHSRTKWTVKFEGKSLFFDWWRVVVGVDFKRKNNRQETCFVLHTHTHTSKSGTNETFHTHTQSKNV